MKTVTQSAEIFGVTRKTIINWIDKGLLKATKPNGVYYIEESEIARLREQKYPKRTIVKEEFVKLAGSFEGAVVLDYMIKLYNESSDNDKIKCVAITTTTLFRDTFVELSKSELGLVLNVLEDKGFLVMANEFEDKNNLYTVNIPLILDEFCKIGFEDIEL